MKYYIDDDNRYIGGTDGSPLSNNEVSYAPGDARQKWNGASYDPVSSADIDAQKTLEADIEVSLDSTIKAFAIVVLDEINLLRVNAGLSERTIAQLKNAVKAKL